jgi:hypothetical protein
MSEVALLKYNLSGPMANSSAYHFFFAHYNVEVEFKLGPSLMLFWLWWCLRSLGMGGRGMRSHW